MKTVYLASASPRRNELLRQVGVTPIIVPSRFNEAMFLSGDPQKIAMDYALGKVQQAFPLPQPGLCIGADTVVAVSGQVLAKPESFEHACEMLRGLSGVEHEVVTGIAIADSPSHYLVECEVTKVRFRPLSEADIVAYVSTGEPMDKAGAYAIQGKAAIFVEGISGCYSNVVGLPLTRLNAMLNKWGLNLTSTWR